MSHQGVDLILAQWLNINAGCDQLRDETLQRSLVHRPGFKNTAPLTVGFHRKWYYVFTSWTMRARQKNSAPAVPAFMHAKAGPRAGGLAPIAAADLQAQLAYQSRITALHQDMRNFYCSYVFSEKAFGPADFEQRPRYQSGLAAQDVPLVQLGVLLLVSLAFAAACLATLRRVNVAR